MVILTLLAYGCYKEKQKEELKDKNTEEKEEGETEQRELENIERELDQLKDDPDDYNYDYGDTESMDKQFDTKIEEHLEIHKESDIPERSMSPKLRPGPMRRPEKRISPQRYPYKVHPYFPRPPPPFHHQPAFEQRFPPKEPRYYHQDYRPRYEPYPDLQRSYPPEPPRHGYYYYNNNNNNTY